MLRVSVSAWQVSRVLKTSFLVMESGWLYLLPLPLFFMVALVVPIHLAEQMKAQRGDRSCPGSHYLDVTGRIWPRSACLQSPGSCFCILLQVKAKRVRALNARARWGLKCIHPLGHSILRGVNRTAVGSQRGNKVTLSTQEACGADGGLLLFRHSMCKGVLAGQRVLCSEKGGWMDFLSYQNVYQCHFCTLS